MQDQLRHQNAKNSSEFLRELSLSAEEDKVLEDQITKIVEDVVASKAMDNMNEIAEIKKFVNAIIHLSNDKALLADVLSRILGLRGDSDEMIQVHQYMMEMNNKFVLMEIQITWLKRTMVGMGIGIATLIPSGLDVIFKILSGG